MVIKFFFFLINSRIHFEKLNLNYDEMEINTLIKTWNEKRNSYDEEYERLYQKINTRKKQIERLENKKSKLKYPHWIEHVLNPLAEEILKELEDYDKSEILGPFGLGCETAIHFYKKGIDRNEAYNIKGAILSITFRPRGETLAIKDYAKKDESYDSNSIGALNGFNYGDLELTNEMTPKWFIDYMKSDKGIEE